MVETADKRRVIMVVDDNDMLRDAIGDVLETKGYATLRACDGAQATNLLSSSDVDMIVLDLQMPVLDGFGVLEWMKMHSCSKPVLVCTGTFIDEGDARLGGTPVIRKPFKIRELLSRLEGFSLH